MSACCGRVPLPINKSPNENPLIFDNELHNNKSISAMQKSMIYDSTQSPKITNTIIMEWILIGMGSDRIPIQIPDDK